jgi:hypothetical protein
MPEVELAPRSLDYANIEIAMYKKTSPDKQTLENFRQALASDPTNVAAANLYWKALGSFQSGHHVIETFRCAALTSHAGVVAFARAYRELSENTGEGPRPVYVDRDLLQALESSLTELPERERSIVEWMLQALLNAKDQREKLIEKLVRTGHLSVLERLKIVPKEIHFSEIAKVVARILDDTGSFPANAKPWVKGHPVYEPAILQRISQQKISLILQRSDPLRPDVLAEQKIVDFAIAFNAVDAFVRSTWPTNIDGIRIAWDS